MLELARAVRPKAIVAGAISYPRAIDWAAFRTVADEVGAYLVADVSQTVGLVAAGVLESPVPYADVVCGVTHKLLRGPRGGLLLCRSALAERLDRAVFPFTQGGPAVDVLAAKALALGAAATPEFTAYAQRTVANAQVLAGALDRVGLRPLTGGTDTHLVTTDARGLGLTGKEVERRCEAAGLLVGRCAVPFDEAPPAEASGVRLGTACATAQGMGPAQMEQSAELIERVLQDGSPERARAVAREVRSLLERFPVRSSQPGRPG